MLTIIKQPVHWAKLVIKTIQFILTLRKIQKSSCTETKDAPQEVANQTEESREVSPLVEAESDFKPNHTQVKIKFN